MFTRPPFLACLALPFMPVFCPSLRCSLWQLAFAVLPPVRARVCASPCLCGSCGMPAAAQVLTLTNSTCSGGRPCGAWGGAPQAKRGAGTCGNRCPYWRTQCAAISSPAGRTCGHVVPYLRPKAADFLPFGFFLLCRRHRDSYPRRGRPMNNENGSIPTVPPNALVEVSLWGPLFLKLQIKKRGEKRR